VFDCGIEARPSSHRVRHEFPRRNFLGLGFTNIGTSEALAWLQGRTSGSEYAYLVTPNVDHMLNLQQDQQLRQIYEGADLCLCDSRILARLASLSGIKLHVVPGSELVSLLLRAVGPGRSICVIGSSSDISTRLSELLPHVKISCHVPPMGLRHNRDAQAAAVAFIRLNPADYIFLAVGSPQQEILADLIRRDRNIRGTALCIGAAISFFTGESKRAPRWMQRLSLEWAYRFSQEPRRLAHRYLVKGPAIFPAYARWLVSERRNRADVEQE
jgi:exopolysaccharide biosynthesis WecB/TagA/CpsF family protein